MSSPLSGQPQVGQGKGGLNSRGQKEISTLSLHGTQMSPKVTMAFAHCERDTVGADGDHNGRSAGVYPNPRWRAVLGVWVGGTEGDRRGQRGKRRANREGTEGGRGRHGQGSTQGARRNPHQAGSGRGIAKDQKGESISWMKTNSLHLQFVHSFNKRSGPPAVFWALTQWSPGSSEAGVGALTRHHMRRAGHEGEAEAGCLADVGSPGRKQPEWGDR